MVRSLAGLAGHLFDHTHDVVEVEASYTLGVRSLVVAHRRLEIVGQCIPAVVEVVVETTDLVDRDGRHLDRSSWDPTFLLLLGTCRVFVRTMEVKKRGLPRCLQSGPVTSGCTNRLGWRTKHWPMAERVELGSFLAQRHFSETS